MRNFLSCVAGLAATGLALAPVAGWGQSTTLVISQIYGGSGTTGATYKNDFFELYNRGTATVDLTGWSIQYASGAGSFTAAGRTALSGSLAPGQYYLVKLAAGGGTTDLPTADATGTVDVDATAGKVALSKATTLVSSPTGKNVVDFVGYGAAASTYEGSGPAPAHSGSTAIMRTGYGTTDTDSNPGDFAAVAPTPHGSTINYYVKAADPSLAASFTSNPDGTGIAPADFTGSAVVYHIVSGAHALAARRWAVSGTNSKVVVESGATLTVPGSPNFVGTLDLSAGATLVQQNGSPAVTFGTVDAGSTVEYGQAGNYELVAADIPGAGFGTLTLRNADKTLPASTVTVRGGLTLAGVTLKGATASPYTTLALAGNLTATGTVAFGGQAARVLLQTTGTASQTLTGGGNQLKFAQLTTTSGSGGVTLADGTDLELGNSTGGGYALATGTTLAVGNNTLSFFAGGKASITTGSATSGTLTLTDPGSGNAGSSLNFNATYDLDGSAGTLLLAAGSQKLNNLTVELRGSGVQIADRTITLPGNMTIAGTLTLTFGRLALGSGSTLNLNGPLTITKGILLGSSTGNLAFNGSGEISGTLNFGGSNAALNSLTLNRDDAPVINMTLNVASNLQVGSLTLTRGIINLTAGQLLTVAGGVMGGNASSYTNVLALPATTTAASSPVLVQYPLGLSGAYRPVGLTVTDNAAGTTYYSAVQYDGPPTTRTLPNALKRVSAVRYVHVEPVTTAPRLTTARITLTFGSDDYVTDVTTLRVAKSKSNDDTKWDNIGQSSVTGSTITSGDFASFSDFVLATTASSPTTNPLPVELTSFAARREGGAVALTWATASEHDSQKFVVERSFDGEAFAPVAEVAAAGSSLAAHGYSAVDAVAPAVALYYRLHQLDLDGSGHYSAVVAVAGSEARTAYPNPTTDRLTVPGAAGLPVTLLDMLGRAVMQVTPTASGQLRLGGLPAGLYLLQVPGQPAQRIRKE